MARRIVASRRGLSLPGDRRGDARIRQSSMALVITLAMVVLVAVAILFFFTYATSNRQIENSRADQIEVDQLTRSGGDYVVHEFLQEIVTNSIATVANNVTIYRPSTNVDGAPLREISSAIGSSDTNFFNLIRQSVAAADTNASTDSTATAAPNGRLLTAARWNAPLLAGGNGFSSTAQLPNWIYVTASQGATNSISSGVIGRFAYNVYDLGGLFDANVAGYASTETTELPGPVKSSVAGAVLTNLPGVTQAAINSLIAFRNPGAAGVYTNDVAATESQNGFLAPTVTNSSGAILYTNNFFLNRQDLIHYAQEEDPPLTNALPYLTTFSRTLNAPSWGPGTNAGAGYGYLANADLASSTNRFLPNVRVQTSGTFLHYNDDGSLVSSAVSAGQPLMQRRFSLAKLAWLTHTGPAPGISAAAIQACFGLLWNSSYKLSATTTTVAGWEYVGSDGGSNVQSSIKTLAQVAAAGREPNFFELLQAGILAGSVAQTGYTSISSGNGVSMGGIYTDTINPNFHIIRIGANIIDQYKSDSFPTALIFGNPAGGTYAFWGTEDLPYLEAVAPIVVQPKFPSPPATNYVVYQLWNPHQPSTNATTGPSQFRVRVNSGAYYSIAYKESTGVNAYPLGTGWFSFPTTPVNFAVNFTTDRLGSDPQRSYREPHVIRDATTPASYLPGLYANALAMPGSQTICVTLSANVNYGFDLQNAVFILDYLDPASNAWQPYATFVGHEENGGATGLGGLNQSLNPGHQVNAISPTATSIPGTGYTKCDPRTWRFDGQSAGPLDAGLRPGSLTTAAALTQFDPSFMSSPWRLAYLASNTHGSGFSYADNDQVTRPGDPAINDENPYSPGVLTYRPVILNRPFTSVAEMGYAFRDLPFKTLDFSSASSADAGLLDLFSLQDDPPVIAGKAGLVTRQSLIPASLFSLAANLTNPAAVATSYNAYAYNASAAPNAVMPRTLADFPLFTGATANAPPLDDIKIDREAPVRALSGTTQSRTWNLLIDVVGQVGQCPAGGTASAFIVEGEKRYWISVAIDRYTGQIVDEQLEHVDE